ncbi:MAG: exosortase/archaeosortase family protein [Steroidobacteraceae bacterium]
MPRAPALVNATPLQFGLRFLIVFGLLTAGFEACRGTAFERWVVEDGVLVPTVHLIDALTPDEHAMLVGRTIRAPGSATLRVTRGCEGIELFLMLVAAIAAFPVSLERRLQGFLIGFLLAYLLSVARLMALHYVLRYSPSGWEALHGLILPLAPVVLMALFFLRWSSADSSPQARKPLDRAA